MTRISFWLVPCAVAVAAIAVLLASPAKEPISKDAPPEDTPPQIFAVLKNTDDLGMIRPVGGETRHRVVFRNVSGRKARIMQVHTGCGCMDTHLDRTELEPGQTAELEVLLRVPDGIRELNKAVVLRTDDPECPLTTFALHGKVEARLAVQPERVDFGTVPASELPLLREITVRGADGPLRVAARSGLVSVEQVLEGEGLTLHVRLHRTQEGSVEDAILIASEDGEEKTVPVSGTIAPELRFSPDTVVLVEGGVADGKPAEVALLWGKETAPIVSLDVSDGLHVECPVGEKPERLKVSCLQASAGTTEAAVGIRTADGMKYTLPVYILAETL